MIYVDNARKLLRSPTLGRVVGSHLWADSPDELVAFADRLGLPRRYLQGPTRAGRHFFYVSQQMRRQAIAAGAKEVAQ